MSQQQKLLEIQATVEEYLSARSRLESLRDEVFPIGQLVWAFGDHATVVSHSARSHMIEIKSGDDMVLVSIDCCRPADPQAHKLRENGVLFMQKSISYTFCVEASTHYSVTEERVKYLAERSLRLADSSAEKRIKVYAERTGETLQDSIDNALEDLRFAFMDLDDVRVVLG